MPVRIAVMGRCDTDLAEIVNGLLDGTVVPPNAGLPPVELHFGAGDTAVVVTGDGRRQRMDRRAFDRLDIRALALVEIAAPLPLLEQATFLVVPLESGAGDVGAAIAWTARRADIVIWSAREVSEAEAGLWRRLPESLLDHGFLALADPPERASDKQRRDEPTAAGFRAVHRLGRGADRAAGIRSLRRALLDHVSAARRQDLEGALMLLDRYVPVRNAWSAAGQLPEFEDPPDFSDLVDRKSDADGSGSCSDDGGNAATEIVRFLAAQADELASLCDVSAPEELEATAQSVLLLCAESIEACGEIAAAEDGPLADTLAEAGDLMLLMQLEATPFAMDDAIALLLQVRRECEARLCA